MDILRCIGSNAKILLAVGGLICLVLLTYLSFAFATTETITYNYLNSGELKNAAYSVSGYEMQYVYDNSGNRTSDAVVAISPMIVAQPSPLNLGTITVGGSSTPTTITVTNWGAAPLQIGTVTIGGTNAEQFAKQNDACNGQTLPSQGTCQINIVFSPAAPATTKTASATINSNDPKTPTLSVMLNGMAQCLYTINPTMSTMPYTDGSGSVTVTSGSGCGWTATSNSTAWLSITAGASGAGNGTVGYSVAATSNSQQRVGTAAIAGLNFSVTQYGEPCTKFSIAPATATYGIDGGSNGTISVTTGVTGCAWNITNIPSWISSIIPQSGTDNTTISFTVAPNTATARRNATMTVAGQPFSIKQGGTLDVSRIGVFYTGYWYLDLNGNHVWDGPPNDGYYTSFGGVGDIPVMGDWNGSGTKKIGVFRSDAHANTGTWYLDMDGNNVWNSLVDATFAFGQAGDIPVVGDWNGNGKTKIGVFRSGTWYLDYPGTGTWIGCGAPQDPTKDACITFGQAGDFPVAGDWTGDGKIKIGVFRNGTWYLDMNENNAWDPNVDATFTFGQAGDIPVVGDWNGNGKTKVGVFRNGTWYLDFNGNNTWDSGDSTINFGAGYPIVY